MSPKRNPMTVIHSQHELHGLQGHLARGPTVKSCNGVLKVKQKLKDHGIESDTRLTWRLQPDGKVFTPKQDGEEDAEERNIN
ncbi:hypothetical protein E1301_Tti023624 [Triplophysa tibetana]|uniref:Uncharacterized protein n=1 Tax=Triplophysa tibetana TaxID=1572043 RepID=A0A5A9PGW0_9TELE|nr:hypothetical protein E1301_Tti023624 [Triplophysa tibetana]